MSNNEAKAVNVMISDLGKCNVEGCDNVARYVALSVRVVGSEPCVAFTCGVCPVKLGLESIRLADLPVFLAAATSLVRPVPRVVDAIEKIRTILGRKP